MASLTGVEVVDMKDGEITKIAYGGEEYARADDPETADIGLRISNNVMGVVHVGSYYSLTKRGGNPAYIDEDGDATTYGGVSLVKFVYFRKTSSPSICTPEKPTIKVGDYAKVIGVTHYEDIREGTIVKIKDEWGPCESYRIELLDETDWDRAHVSGLGKVSDEDVKRERNKALFLKIGRGVDEYEIGDVVRVTDAWGSSHAEGDVGVVVEYAYDGNPLVFVKDRRKDQYVVVEPISLVESRVSVE